MPKKQFETTGSNLTEVTSTLYERIERAKGTMRGDVEYRVEIHQGDKVIGAPRNFSPSYEAAFADALDKADITPKGYSRNSSRYSLVIDARVNVEFPKEEKPRQEEKPKSKAKATPAGTTDKSSTSLTDLF